MLARTQERISADYSPTAPIGITQVVATADRIADTIPIVAYGRASSADAASVVNWIFANAQMRSGDALSALDGENAAEWSADKIRVLEMAGVLATYPAPPGAKVLRIEFISLPTVRLTVHVYEEETDLTDVAFYANYLKCFERGRSDAL